MEKIHPTTVVIFGATGDLFRKKLSAALLDLFSRDFLPKKFRIVAFSRRPWSREEFHKFMRETFASNAVKVPIETIDRFLKSVYYVEGDLNNLESYNKVAQLLSELDAKAGVCTNKLFYLATPPTAYEGILKNISASGLAIPCAPSKDQGETGWTRILIEKPFGSDLKTAREIDLLLSELFSENQIFRIDHYLAKETVQNILTFRFVHSLLERNWNNKFIDRVEVKLLEKNDVGIRGSFYDGLGALRDVGQNHLLELAALVAMEKPVSTGAVALQRARGDVLSKFKIWSGKDALAIRGQYNGYLEEAGVDKNSKTETYFKVKLALPTKRFKGVPFILESGKALLESRAEVIVYFKKPISSFCVEDVCQIPDKFVVFKLHPDEIVKPKVDSLGAYEKVLSDAILGDQTLFISTDEVLAEWKIVRDIFKVWQLSKMVKYEKGIMPNIK
ncbi:MAG: glucose-6-phosphate dehydrogenase (NADP(+)) [Candidatus Taylorbacteria bacterium]|nr:glucose-6-phosphate dehydrogenase (NADP(+)) [Candidatus Taylorbacteria bacterium]